MQHRSCIKGTLLIDLAREVRDLEKKGVISPEDLETRLRPLERNLLEDDVLASEWYEVESFRRLAKLLSDRAGGGSEEYPRVLGFAAGQRLLEAGIYQQMNYLDRAEIFAARTEKERVEAGRHDLRLLTSLSASLLNFSRWQVVPDSEHKLRHRIEIADALDFCDALAWYAEGVIDAMATRQRLAKLWRWSRVSDDFIVFYMTRDALPDPAAGDMETGLRKGAGSSV